MNKYELGWVRDLKNLKRKWKIYTKIENPSDALKIAIRNIERDIEIQEFYYYN
jgi:uncharacterized LabA/DUF88 family protein